jgi:hypothetical protein
MPRRLRIRTAGKPAVVIHRSAVRRDCVVYIAVGNKASKYPYGRSKIVYIGTTKAGASRIAQSAAGKARELLALHGVTHLEFHVVSCRPRQKVRTWRKMERGLILCFREIYGQIPKSNRQGKGMKWRDERKFFTEAQLRSIIQKYS